MTPVPRLCGRTQLERASAAGLLAAIVLTGVVLSPDTRAKPMSGKAAVASEHPLVTRAAHDALRAGGNAVDAAVAAALMAGVVSPSSSGLGGGGFALVWSAADKTCHALDFRETAPRAVDAPAFEARPLPFEQRGKLVGVPGELSGLLSLHEQYGRRSFARLAQPAAERARRGFPVSEHLAGALRSNASVLVRDPGLAQRYLPQGAPALAGKRLKNPELARTLDEIAARGRAALTRGPLAASLVETVRKAGGALELEELAGYVPRQREPLRLDWEGYSVCTMPPPSAGGMLLAQVLRLYSRAELARLGLDSGAYQHMLAEAMRGAIADRLRFVGDPDIEAVPTAALIAEERMARRKRRLAPDLTHALPRFSIDEQGTHHLTVADEHGNVACLTTTVNRAFGAKILDPLSGIVLNDELDDFTAQSDVEPFGLRTSPNRPRAGARPVSSMTPTIVSRDGRPLLALGGSGGTAIPTNVTQVLLRILAFGMSPDEAVAKARFYVPFEGATIWLEAGAPAPLARDLEWRGELVGTMPYRSTAVQVVTIDDNGNKRAAADPRKGGSGEAR
jgi:gamma-glutamyltranspeptidase/glutathione hydrolase